MNARFGFSLLAVAALGLALAGCVSKGEANRAMLALDADWAPENDDLFRGDGRRIYRVDASAALDAMDSTMRQLRLTVRRRDAATGSLVGDALAPRPLNDEEWKDVAEIERPRMRGVIAREVGPISSVMFSLEPKSYLLIFAAAVSSTRGETTIGITAQMRNIDPIPGIVYPANMPPEAARRGVAKLWATFEAELRKRGIQPVRGAAPARNAPERSS